MMMTMTELAGELHVDRRQVWTWHKRRDRNGFPAPVRTIKRLGREVPVWDLAEVKEWRRGYRPSLGGRPVARTAS